MAALRHLAVLTCLVTSILSRCTTTSTALGPSASDSSLPTIYSSDVVPKVTVNSTDNDSTDNDSNYTVPYFPLLGFQQYENNPILSPNPAQNWESAYLYNPAAIVVDEMVWLPISGTKLVKTSSIGLAWSTDGYNFTRYTHPVLNATEPYEHVGGTEDPRIIRVNGTFYLTYTGYDTKTARLCLAMSTDLVNWTKYGPIIPNATDVVYNWQTPLVNWTPRQGWSKSGAILNKRQPDGTYHMHRGDSFLYFASSTDLIHWNVTYDQPPFAPKLNVWEQGLMESAASPVKPRDGKWIKFYNGVATGLGGYPCTIQHRTDAS